MKAPSTKLQAPRKRRKGLRLVRQEDRSGCGLACVAMVMGMDYQNVRRVWLECLRGEATRLDTIGDGLNAGELVNLLGYLGVFILYVTCCSEGWKISGAGIQWTILSVPVANGLKHWVVRDHQRQIELDPAKGVQ